MAETEKDETATDEAATTTLAGLDYDALAESLRSRVDLLGKALAGLATIGTTAVSLTTVNDLAPTAGDGRWGASIAAMLFLLLAGASAVGVAVQLMRVNQPVVLDVDPSAQSYGAAADHDVERIYRNVAEQAGYTTLAGLQGQVRALRVAARNASSEDERARRTALAGEGQAVIDEALARARWAVVRRQAAKAAGGPLSSMLYLGVLLGLLGFAYCADAATDPEKDNIAAAKSCAEARSAGAVDDDLDRTVCAAPTSPATESPSDAATPTDEQNRAKLSKALTEVLTQCADLVPTQAAAGGPALSRADCAAIAALAAAIFPSAAPAS